MVPVAKGKILHSVSYLKWKTESIAQAGYGKPSFVILDLKVLLKPMVLLLQKTLYSSSEFKNYAMGVVIEYLLIIF